MPRLNDGWRANAAAQPDWSDVERFEAFIFKGIRQQHFVSNPTWLSAPLFSGEHWASCQLEGWRNQATSFRHAWYQFTLPLQYLEDSWRAFQGKRPLSIPRPRLHVASLGWSTVSQAQLPQDRLKPQESRLKSEDDEDDWLPALRKLQLGTVGRPCCKGRCEFGTSHIPWGWFWRGS